MKIKEMEKNNKIVLNIGKILISSSRELFGSVRYRLNLKV